MKEQKESRGNRGNREEGKHKILGQDSSNKNKEDSEKIQILDAHRQIVNQGNKGILDRIKEIKLAMQQSTNVEQEKLEQPNSITTTALPTLQKNVEKGKGKNYV